MNEPEKLVQGSGKLTAIFGHWPSFHDAEVMEFNLCRGDVGANAGGRIFPVLTTKIHLWGEPTSELDDHGCFVSRHHTLTTLRFHDVDEIRVEGFNHQNVIFGLRILSEERDGGLPPFICVEFQPIFGISATFRCCRIEVVDAEPFPQSTRDT